MPYINFSALEYTRAEENYLKAIYGIAKRSGKGANTNAIAQRLDTKASSVTDMIKKLSEKSLVQYKKYQGAKLTDQGQQVAVEVIRKHRLWETFLVKHLRFKWDEVHDIAEQLEHVRSSELVDRLDAFMDHPKFDPHGDPIPDKEGNIEAMRATVSLSEIAKDDIARLVGVRDSSDEFLRFLDGIGLRLGTQLTVVRRFEFDNSVEVSTHFKSGITMSQQVCDNLVVQPL